MMGKQARATGVEGRFDVGANCLAGSMFLPLTHWYFRDIGS